MAEPTPPRTPTARKSLPGSPSIVTSNVTTLGSPIAVQKRNWQGNKVSLPLQGLTQPENMSKSAPVSQFISAKRQRVSEEIGVRQYVHMSASPLRNQSFIPSMAGPPSKLPQFQQSIKQDPANDWPNRVFLAALQSNRTLLSGNPLSNPITSQCIDSIAYAMWQVIFNHENMMRDVTTKVAMFSQLKLRALARLNYLPSWWYLREMACGVMEQQGWHVDDSEMQKVWGDTVKWCGRIGMRMGVQDDNAAVAEQIGEDVDQDGVERA